MTDIAIASPRLDAHSLRERVTMCRGVITPEPAPADGGDAYIAGALIPATAFRPIDDATWDALRGAPRSMPGIGTSIYLDRLEERLIDWLRDFESGGPKHALTSMRASATVRRAVERRLDASESVRRLGPVLGIGPAPRNHGGLATLTRTYPESLRTGLHIDHWDHLSLTRCAEAANRLCVNLGEGVRYLLFAPLSAAAMYRRVRRHDPDARADARADLVPAFFALEPRTPILRLEIHPSEAYYAPTENLVHDASSLDATSVDRTVQIRGFLMPAAAIATTRVGVVGRKPIRRIPIHTIASSGASTGTPA